MAEVKTVGEVQPLGKSPVTPPTNGGGNPTAQIVGEQVQLSNTPHIAPFYNKPGQGQVQQVGDSLPLGKSPTFPWPQANLPQSGLTNMGKK